MRAVIEARELASGDPIAGAQVVLRDPANAAIATYATDDFGRALVERDGSPGRLVAHVTHGGITRRQGMAARGSGPTQWGELGIALQGLLGNGVAVGYGTALAPSAGTGLAVNVAAGTCLAGGTQYTQYRTLSVALAANNEGGLTRVDRVVVRAQGRDAATPGACALAVVQGTAGAGAPALTQSSLVWEEPLCAVTVPFGASSLSGVEDERRWLLTGSVLRRPPVVGVARRTDTTVVSVGTGGEYRLTVPLALENGVTYGVTVGAALVVKTTSSSIGAADLELRIGSASVRTEWPNFASAYELLRDGFAASVLGTGATVNAEAILRRNPNNDEVSYKTAILTAEAWPRS